MLATSMRGGYTHNPPVDPVSERRYLRRNKNRFAKPTGKTRKRKRKWIKELKKKSKKKEKY